ncbi:CHAT domain-containing protein [Aureispira]|nr:CHAT domain-containing protein [Aureispira sp.]
MRNFISFLFSFFLIGSISAQDSLDRYSLVELIISMESQLKAKSYDKLMPYAKKALSKIEKEKAKGLFQDTTFARVMYFMGLAHYNNHDFSNAEPFYLKAIENQKNAGQNSLKCAEYLYSIGNVYLQTGRYFLAESPYLESLDIFKDILGKEHAHYAACLNNLAVLNVYLERYEQAEPYYKESITLRKKLFGVTSIEYGSSLNNLAMMYMDIGNYSDAEPLYKRAIDIIKDIKGDKDPAYASALNNLGLLYLYMGQHEQAEPLYKVALEIRKNVYGINSYDYASSLNNLASLYTDIGRLDESELLYLESMEIRKEIVGEYSYDYASSLNNLASLYRELNDFDKAQQLYIKSLEIWRKLLGNDHLSIAAALNNLALVYENTEQYEKAERLLLKSMQMRKKILGSNHIDYAASLTNLSSLYLRLLKYDLAEKYIKESLQILLQQYGEKHPEYIGDLYQLAMVYQGKKDYTASLRVSYKLIEANCGLKTTEINKEWGSRLANANYISIDYMISVLEVLYEVIAFASDKNLDESLQIELADNDSMVSEKQLIIANLGMDLLKNTRDAFISSEDKLRRLSASSDWVFRSLEILDPVNDVELAFDLAEHSKSVLLMDAVKSERAYSFGDLPDSLKLKEVLLQQQHDEYKAGLLEPRIKAEKDSLRTKLNQINLEINRFRNDLEINHPKYAAFKYNQRDIGLEQIQSLIDENTALLEYVLSDSIMYIFYVDREKIRLEKCSIPLIELNMKISDFHDGLSSYTTLFNQPEKGYLSYTVPAYWFYKNLVAPILKYAEDINHLIIVPDGELGYLPFETFLVEEVSQKISDYAQLHYLLNDYSISYNYSASLWVENTQSSLKTNNGQIFAMATNYKITLDSTSQNNRLPSYLRLRNMLKPLPAARKEVELLQEQFMGRFLFDESASETYFKKNADEYSIIHLAMHGLMDAKSPIMSSLVFTEDGDSLENNFLFAHEISKLKLNADLVVLSACETAYGKVEKGNGIASLARSFMYAGVPSLIVSLWHVDDLATSKIMEEFYHNLSDGMPKGDALRQAKLRYIKSVKSIYAHPAFWSPFIQIGDNSSLKVAKKGSEVYIYILSFFGILLAAFFVRMKLKTA